MTYADYTTICIGRRDARIRDLKMERQRQWLLVCSFKSKNDPPRTMHEFWPMDDDPAPRKPPTPKQIKKHHNNFLKLIKYNG